MSLTIWFGWSGGPTTQTLAYGLGVGAAARLAQIIHELRRLHTATRHTTPVVVAGVDDHDDA